MFYFNSCVDWLFLSFWALDLPFEFSWLVDVLRGLSGIGRWDDQGKELEGQMGQVTQNLVWGPSRPSGLSSSYRWREARKGERGSDEKKEMKRGERWITTRGSTQRTPRPNISTCILHVLCGRYNSMLQMRKLRLERLDNFPWSFMYQGGQVFAQW